MRGCSLPPPILTHYLRSLLVSVLVIVTVTNGMEKAPALEFSDSWHEIGSTRGRDTFFVLVKASSPVEMFGSFLFFVSAIPTPCGRLVHCKLLGVSGSPAENKISPKLSPSPLLL